MFLRVTAILAFTDPDEANDFYTDCKNAIKKSSNINPLETYGEISHIAIHECHHDLNPAAECILIQEQFKD